MFKLLLLILSALLIHSGLCFRNNTSVVPGYMVTSFINFSNSASDFYKDDLEANSKYIVENMNKLYATEGHSWTLFIQTDVVDYNAINYAHGSISAYLDSINLLYPKWSYLFTYGPIKDSTQRPTFIQTGIVGAGVNATIVSWIEKAIALTETVATCNSIDATYRLRNELATASGSYKWDIYSDPKGVTSAYTFTANQIYGVFKPRKCYYLIYMFDQI